MQTSQRFKDVVRPQVKQLSKVSKKMSSNYSVLLRGEVQSKSLDEAVDVARTNIVLVKVVILEHFASSRSSGVTREIGAHHGLNGVFNYSGGIAEFVEPGVWTRHGALDAEDFGGNFANEPICTVETNMWKDFIQALKYPTFLWTMVRNPAARVSSLLYSKESHVTSSDKISFLKSYDNESANFQFKYIRSSAEDSVDDIFQKYGLVGVAERFDESIVVLAATLKIPLRDVLYVKVAADDPRNSANWDDSLSEQSFDVETFLNNEFKQMNALDYEVYRRANELLDERIAEMNLKSAINTFLEFLEVVQNDCGECIDYDGGYVEDEGCNYQCLDRYDGPVCEWCE